MTEDLDEQLGKVIYSGFFLNRDEDEIDKRLRHDLCPRCMCKLELVDVHGHRQCKFCKCVIEDCCEGSKNV